MLYIRRNIIHLCLLACLAVLAACSSAETATPATAPGISLDISSPECPSVFVKAGNQVTWTNKVSVEHQVIITAANGNLLFDSGILQPGDSTSFTFIAPGVYTCYCSPDQTMPGTIAVEP